MEDKFSVPTKVREAYDVIVVGGGIAGISAAVAAGRLGSRVLLIEKGILLGGLATVGLISWYEPLCDGEGTQLIGGIGEELIRLATSVGYDNLPEEWGGTGHKFRRNRRFSSHFSPTFFALALDGFVKDAGVQLLFDTRATYPVMEGNRCTGVLTENLNGREFYPAGVVIDASGDAGIVSRAGIPCEGGVNYLSYIAHSYDISSIASAAESRDLVRFRHWESVGASCSGKGHPEGMKTFRGDSAEELTEFVLTGRKMLFDKYRDSDKDTRDLMMLPTMPQYRKIRHIVGKTVFLGVENDVPCADSIGWTGDFRHAGKRFSLAYSTLYHPDFPNLLTAGRVISASGEGWEIVRVIPTCALTGQAAGTAASLAVSSGTDVPALPYEKLHAVLEKNGTIFR